MVNYDWSIRPALADLGTLPGEAVRMTCHA